MSQPTIFWRWVLTLCVPAASLVILGRQLYLSAAHDLSTWKGGGMGMFAAADGLQNRYAKIFLTDSNGSRNPLTQFSEDERELLIRALEYPERKNFLRAARELAKENWVATSQPNPVTIFDRHGEAIGRAEESFHVMSPYGQWIGQEKPKGKLEFQFWKIDYNPITKRARATLVQTFTFEPAELLPAEAERTKS